MSSGIVFLALFDFIDFDTAGDDAGGGGPSGRDAPSRGEIRWLVRGLVDVKGGLVISSTEKNLPLGSPNAVSST